MFQLKKLLNLESFTNLLLSLIPISLIAGSFMVNLNVLLFLIAGIILIKKKKLIFQLNKINLFLTMFFILIIISSIINFEIAGQENIIKSILLLKFLALYFVIEILSINGQLNLRKLFTISLICTSFVSIDVLIQYTFGKNILGYDPLPVHVVSGIFFDEGIAGGYIQKLFLLSLLGLLIFYDKKSFPKIFIIPVVLIHTVAVFVTTNKMPFVLIIFSIILLILFFKELRINLIVCLILSIAVSTIIAKSDSHLSKIYYTFSAKIFGKGDTDLFSKELRLKKTGKKVDERFKQYGKLAEYNFFSQGLSSEHGRIYLLTFQSFKKSVLIGNGLRSLRANCNKVVIPNVDSTDRYIKGKLCLSHPHNFHLEILTDAGLLGYLFVTLFVLFTFLASLKNYRYKTTFIEKSIFVFIFLNFFIEIWPLKSTGSLFTTWNGTITWLTVALSSYNLKNTSLK